jgi:hypothetical protein
MNDRFLVVYNTCEIRGNNLFWYIDCIRNLLDQEYDNFQIAVSGCQVSSATKAGLVKQFGKRLFYNFIDENHTVNVTFNHTVNRIAKEVGPYNGYVYVDSGMNTQRNTHVLKEINQRSNTRRFGMVTVQSSNDTGYEGWFGKTETYTFTGEDFIVPVGRCCNLHLQYFDDKLLQNYGGLMPDIFKTNCTESTFSFLNAALKLKWVIVKDLAIFHNKGADGPSSLHLGNYYGHKEPWNNLIENLDAKTQIMTPEANALGMGYEEMGNVFPHDPSLYDSNGFAIKDGLKDFIRKNLFVVDTEYIKKYLNFYNETLRLQTRLGSQSRSDPRIRRYHPFQQRRNCTTLQSRGRSRPSRLFLYGQVSDGNIDNPNHPILKESFEFLDGREHQHILDLEGDWCALPGYGGGAQIAHPWVLKCIKSCAPTKYAHWVPPILARPNLSGLLAFLKQNPECEIEFPDEVSFGFRGQPDPINTRVRTGESLKRIGVKHEVTFNTSWGGRKGLDSPAVSLYIESLYKNLISLCPEGVSSATIRFYETCFFGRVPVIVGEQMVMEEGDYDTSFLYKIDPTLGDQHLDQELLKIANTPHSELVEKGKAARQYFMDVVMKYFQDPTGYFIEWMKRKNLYQER